MTVLPKVVRANWSKNYNSKNLTNGSANLIRRLNIKAHLVVMVGLQHQAPIWGFVIPSRTFTAGSRGSTPNHLAQLGNTGFITPISTLGYTSSSRTAFDTFRAPIANALENLLHRFMEAYLENRRAFFPVLTFFLERENIFERRLKAQKPDFYCGNSHIEYYYLYIWCKDHFDIACANRREQVLLCSFICQRSNFIPVATTPKSN